MAKVPVAIVGVSALFAGSKDGSGFWRDILAGKDLITDVPPSHWLIEDHYDPDPKAMDKTYAKRGAFLEKIDFDPMEHGMPPNIVPATDTSQLLSLIVAQQVLDDASRGQFANMDREKMSVILGVTSGQELMGSMVARLQRPQWLKGLRESGIPEAEAIAICDRISSNYVPWQEASFPGLLGNVVAGRIANRFDLHGTNAVTDAACASTLSALSMSLNELYEHQADVVITGGVDAMNDIFMWVCFSKTPALSKTGDCRPFSDNADGTLLGEGMAMFALKRLEDAERDGDHVYAVIQGIGSSSDGRGAAVYAPVAKGQARAIRRAYETAGFGTETVELVEAHGTGTVAGDAAEFEGLRSVFDESGRTDRQWCAIGSVKSQIGHTKSAAGAAGLFKAVMGLHHRVLPPTIKVDRVNPKLDINNSPFYVNTKSRPWIRGSSHVRRAGLSSFGFGGSNFHVALEEYTGKEPAWRTRTMPTELVLISGDSAAAVADACKRISTEIASTSLAAVARKTQTAWDASKTARLAIVALDAADATAKLADAASKVAGGDFATPTGVFFSVGQSTGKVAFLFPGQGSQYVDMGSDLAIAFDEARGPWDDAADVQFDGKSVHELVFPRPVFSDADRDAQQVALTATEWAQPAIGVASLSALALLRRAGAKADMVGGHSFGEVTALAAAGVIAQSDLVKVARERGAQMRDAAARPGSMLAVGKSIDEVKALVEKHGAKVVVANHNHPTQVVLSGATDAIVALNAALAAEGIAAKQLPVATAFHSPIVEASVKPFGAALETVAFAKPNVDVWSNSEAAPYSADPKAIRQALAAAIARPVRFVEQIEAMYAAGARTFIEVGPGSVLTELVGRILGKRPHTAIATDRKGKHGITTFHEALGKMAIAGMALDFAPLWARFAPPVPPKKKGMVQIPINGINYGKPYPPEGGSAALPKPNPPRPAPVAAPIAAAAPVAAARPASPEAPPMSDNRNASNDAQLAWVAAYQDAQRQTAEAHASWQQAMAATHMQFLRAVETSFIGLGAMMGAPMPAGTPMPQQFAAPMPNFAPPTFAMPAVPAPTAAAPQVYAPQASVAPAYVVPTPAAPVPQAAPVAAPAAAGLNVEALMMNVVAEKTGYPAEMLGLHMELEGDLGIDSIKRVEILSTMRERAPQLPEVDPGEMGKLRTVGEIVDYMRSRTVGATAASPAAVVTPAAAPKAGTGLNVEALMMNVVAEKTGYPAEMLGLHMELEGDLGIDSIKRVEILSTMRERAPELPEVDAGEMGKLRTVGEIVDYMRSRTAGATGGQAVAQPAAAAGTGLDVEALMMNVVAEKTGYPAEMLGLHMELEGDLGIDSIKRVEILSTMRERAPELPEVDAGEMGKLRTVGEIVDYMRSRTAGAAAPSTQGAAAETDHGISRFAVREEPVLSIGLSLHGLTAGGRIVVTDDGAGLAGQVARRLGEHGVNAEVVDVVPADADGVIFLGGTRAVASETAAIAVNREAFAAARAVAKRFTDRGGVFVTVQQTGGDFGLSGAQPDRAWVAGISALARTVAIEWPKASVKAIDVAEMPIVAMATAIVDELLQGGNTREVGLKADGQRITLRSVPVVAGPPTVATVDAQSVIVASGGARGVTATCLIELARVTKAKIVVLGRTALADEPAAFAAAQDDASLKRAIMQLAQAEGRKVTPAEVGASASRLLANREIRGTLSAIARAGGQAKYVPADVQDGPALSKALDEIRRTWGPITGIVHGAGVLADKLVAEKTPEMFDRVFDTKVEGLRALLAATANDPLRVVCLFSSVAARAGNLGQSDYAMANEVLNKVGAALRTQRGIVVKSIGWGPWEGGMVTPALKARFQQMGVALIPLDVGARMFVDELRTLPAETETVVGGEVGEGPLGAAGGGEVTLDVRVSKRSHGFLADHAVGGKVVVPVVLAVEWMARAAKAVHPELSVARIRDIKVLRGIRLDHWDGAGDNLTVTAQQLSNGSGAVIAVLLQGPNGERYYSATVELAETRVVGTPVATPGGLAPWTDDVVYDGRVLFHGPQFQVIRSLDGLAGDSLVATLDGAAAGAWSHEALTTDPALLDGGLQLVLLWAKKALGGASLPMAVAAVTVYAEGASSGPVRCVVRGHKTNETKTLCDVAFTDAAGRLIAELRGVETVLRPDERAEHGNART